MKKLYYLILCAIITIITIIAFAGCGTSNNSISPASVQADRSGTGSETDIKDSSGKIIKYSDLRAFYEGSIRPKPVVYSANEYIRDDITSYTFNEAVMFEGSEDYRQEVMEMGKDPGLDIRSLHDAGITGKGVNVAIIDQNLLLDHPEFAGKIAAYYYTGYSQPPNQGSMHAPAVTSLLVGDTIGVAPGAKVYFAAAPSWTLDSEYCAKGLYWIIEENRKLPEGEKIRVVSISAAPSGTGSPFTKNNQMWDEAVAEAEKEGIMVLDCTMNKEGFIQSCFFADPFVRNVPQKLSIGFPSSPNDLNAVMDRFKEYNINIKDILLVPSSPRTVAEQYNEGEYSYMYTGVVGRSWAIPYAAGVLALGWQINPGLSNGEIKGLLFSSAYVDENSFNYIDPAAFIEAVKLTLEQ